MAITGGSNLSNRKTNKERYLDEDNVIDITKNDLTKLKSNLKISEEDDLDTKLNKINDIVEKYFDGVLLNDREKNITLTINGNSFTDSIKNIVMSGSQEQLNALANNIIITSRYQDELNQIQDEEIKEVLKNYEFEIDDLRGEITGSSVTHRSVTNKSYEEGNSFLNNPGEGSSENNKESAEYHMYEDYIDPYKNWGTGYTIPEDMDIENIYKDNKLHKVMERIFDNEDKKELRRGNFKINLDKEDGLAGIIVDIREAAEHITEVEDLDYENIDKKDPEYTYKRIIDLLRLSIDEEKGIIISADKATLRKEIKELVDEGTLKYKGGIGDYLSLAKIFDRAQWEDLDTFASLIQSKDDVAMAVKEWNNALILTGQNREIKEGEEQTSLISDDNVLEFLCDFNSDGLISAEYNKKLNKNQENQGDVGPLFGQQVYFTIEQAIKIQEIENPGEGEQQVIWNIIKNMEIADSRYLEHVHLNSMKNDPSKCTKENLALLINGREADDYDENGIYPMPEMKIFFLDAIKKINGGSQITTPNLYDTLIGKDMEIGIDLLDNEEELDSVIFEILTKSEDSEIIALIKKHGLVQAKETFLTKIMTVIDNVEITTNDGATTTLQAAGISKGWEVQETKNKLIEKMIQQILTTGIHYMKDKGFILSVGKGQSGRSETGKTKRAWSVGGGLEIGSDGLSLFLGGSGEIAEQINNKRVINANLSKVRDAHYLGIEGSAKAGLNTKNVSVNAEASAGLFRNKDPIIGIEQIDTQYKSISEIIFKPENSQLDNILTSAEACKKYFEDKIEGYKNDATYGEFVTTNEQHLKDNANFIVRYMEANNVFGETSVLSKKSNIEKLHALTKLFKILQTGNREARRHDVVAGLHGKIDITKLSFGVTTSALTASFGRRTEKPTAISTSGETTEPGDYTGGYAGNEGLLGTDRFGIAGFYAGLRISTWKNTYVPNTEQYLFKEYQIGKGFENTNTITSTTESLNKYSDYLNALYNDDRLVCYTKEGKIMIEFIPKPGQDTSIQEFLNLHVASEAESNFTLKNNTLTIGNVGPIGAYTVTEAKGVRRVLCLGSKELDGTRRIDSDYSITNKVEKIEAKHTGYENWTSNKLRTELIPSMTGQGTELQKAKDITASFFDVEGKLTTPTGATVTFSPEEMEGQEVSVGTVIITKKIDGTYYVAIGTSPTDKLKIEYIDDQEHKKALEEEKKKPTSREKHSYSVDKLFSFESSSELGKAQTLLNTIGNDIKDFEKNSDNTNKTEYLQFLSAASNIIDNYGFIDDREINKAIEYLKQLLPNSSNKFDELYIYLNSSDWYTKSFAVNKLKQIFAKDARYSGKTLSYILANHRGWETVTGPSGEQLPSSLLQEFQNQRANRKQSSALYDELPQTNPNLLGYTAFYRYAGTQYKNVKFSTTSLGSTSSQVEPYIIQDNVSEAKNRFLKNLEINTKEVKQLASSLEQQFLKNGATVKLLDTDYKKTFENIKELLEGNSIILDSGQKISIDINWVFYLLGECCNESIGIDIKKIIITSLKDDIVLPGKYITEGTPDKVYAYETQINGGSLSVSSEVNSKEYKAGITHHQTREQKPGEIVESGETKEPTPANPENNNIGGETTEPGTYGSGDTEEEGTWGNSE